MKNSIVMILTALSIVSAEESDWKELFPQKHRVELMVKGGYCKDRSTDTAIPSWAATGEYRFPVHYYKTKKGAESYFQVATPVRLYHFPTKESVLGEIRLRPDWGPPPAKWFPSGFVDIGYSWGSRDWFTHSDNQVHSLSIGGWFLVPLRIPNDGVFMVQGSKSIAGDKLTRYSCYTHWYFTKHFGMTIHGDNFSRRRNGQIFGYGSMNVGFMYRW